MNLFSTFTEEFKTSGIYLLSICNHKYIGSSQDIQKRILAHRAALLTNRHNSVKMQKAFNLTDKTECFCMVLERDVETSDLLSREEFFISVLKPDLNVSLSPLTNFNTITTSKKVYQYDLDGNYINEFVSVREAERVIGNSAISVAANPRCPQKTAGGFQWRYTKYSKIPKYINRSAEAKIKSVYVYNLEGKMMHYFKSIAECVRELFPTDSFDTRCASISACMRGHLRQTKNLIFSKELLSQTEINKILSSKRARK